MPEEDGNEQKLFTQEQINSLLAKQKREVEGRYADYDDLKTRAAKADQLEQNTRTETEKAVEKAREEGRSEIRAQLGLERARTALDKALQGRTPDTSALIGLDLAQFVKGDQADTSAITSWAEQFPEAGQRPQQTFQTSTTFGQGTRQTVQPKKGERGAAEAARRFGGNNQ